ncbi:LamG-like jellyroll fold domain-containing protein [Streptomyces sp. NPDC087440]|uniref:LamG domain-containing protein n=1 Tax=Streptomyces sp. NPDC087440 TaxID=3365790 RepID=UPI003814E5A9
MSVDLPANSRLKTYSDREYVHTTLVRHQGTTIALAIDEDRRLYYSVLDLNGQATGAGSGRAAPAPGADLDVLHWSEEPRELRFPAEIARAGFAAAGAARLPRVQLGGAAEEGPGKILLDDEVDDFRSGTGRLTAPYPFQVVSDGKHVFVFRQAVGADHEDALYRLTSGGTTGDKAHPGRQTDSAQRVVQVAPDALLCDRFVLTGTELKPVQEVRYRRSRHRDQPESAKDSLGTTDMNGRPFYEPTLVLGFAGKVTEGRFAVLLVPTLVADTSRWQFFLADAAGTGIESVNVEQSEDGRFHTQGSRLYRCPNAACKDAVLERAPGVCAASGHDLVPVQPDTRFAEAALSFAQGYGELATGGEEMKLGPAPYTVEAWIRPTAFGGTILATTGGADGTAPGGIRIALTANGGVSVTHGLADGTTATVTPYAAGLKRGEYQHIGIAYNGKEVAFYKQGYWKTWAALVPACAPGSRLLVGASAKAAGTPGDFFAGEIDEVRVWHRRRPGVEMNADFATRLVGDEPGLAAYYRFDEGTGTTVYDQSGHGRDLALGGSTAWTESEAPVADHPGIRRDSFRLEGRTVAGGLSAVLHHQQEEGAVGHEGTAKPLKRQARVLLAWTASKETGGAGGTGDTGVGRIATLDFAVANDGRLAQVPDVLALPKVGANLHEVNAERMNALKLEIPLVEAELEAATKALDILKGDVADPDRLEASLRKAMADAWQAGAPAADGSVADCLLVTRPPNSRGPADYEYIAYSVGSDGVKRPVLRSGTPGETDSTALWTGVPFGERASAPAGAQGGGGGGLSVSDEDENGGGDGLGAPARPESFGDGISGGPFGGLSGGPFGGLSGGPSDGSASADSSGWHFRSTPADQFLSCSGKDPVVSATGTKLTYSPGTGLLTGGGNQLHRHNDGRLVMNDAYVMNGESVSVTVHIVPVRPAATNAKATQAASDVRALLARAGEYRKHRDHSSHLGDLIAQHTQLTNTLKSLLEELGRVSGGTLGRSEHTEPVAHLGTDRCGLGHSGALLDFAKTGTTPHLADSGTGHLGLYFRDEQEQLTGLFYDANVGRSGKSVEATGGTTLRLTARDAGIDLKGVRVTVTADTTGPFADRCTLTLADKNGDTETWSLLPRRVTALADALNGLHAEPARVGVVSSLKAGTLTLDVEGARRALAAGDLLDIGGTVYAVAAPVAAKATEVRVKHGPATAEFPADTPVQLVGYAPALVTHTRPGASAAFGSRLVTASLTGTAGTVKDGTAKDIGKARPPRWWGDLPGRSLVFAAGTQLPSLPEDADRETVKHTDDVTVEAWLHPAEPPAGTTVSRIVHAHVPDPTGGPSATSRYTLALGAAGTDKRRHLIAGVGDNLAVSRGTVPVGEWTHVAAAFEQSWALDFAHARAVVEAPHAEDLNIARDLTLEVFLQVAQLGGVQGLLSKGRIDDGTGKRVPYQLSVNADGKLVFAFEDATGREIQAVSKDALTPGTFHRIAVVRKLTTVREDKMGTKTISFLDKAGKAIEQTFDALESVVTHKYTDITFHIDRKTPSSTRYQGHPELSHPGPLDIGRARNGVAEQPFSGIISELRIWNTALADDQLCADLPRETPTGPGGVPAKREGLVAHWRFEENEGNAAQDESGSHTAKVRGAVWTKNPDPEGSTFRLYLNGRATEAMPYTEADKLPYGDRQFTLAGRVDGGTATTSDRYVGTLEEVRVWRTARSEEQLLDNLYGRLTGDTADLLAYYPFDDESTSVDATKLIDYGPRGVDLPLSATRAARPEPVMSTAPISSDTPEVRSAFATGRPLFVQKTASAPAVSEYADLQLLRDGSTRGVLKRAYAYVQNGQWQLITGFKLGDLKSEWVGQVQFAPQLIGYVEGAPPVPSENLVATRRPTSLSYINTTSVEFKQADEVVESLSSSKDTSVDASLEFGVSADFNFKSRIITAPLGIGTSTPITEIKANLRGGASLEYSNGWGDQTELSEGLNTTRSTLVGLGGAWDPEHEDDAKKGGRRFQPANMGFALVQSETADVFALRLAHTGAVVAYRMLPNPDIPRDWNLIPFAINPRYVKQGTLDGTVGFKEGAKLLDPDYQDATDRGDYSYFKPREAYALKRRIVEDMQRRQAYYEGVSTETHHPDPTAERARGLLSSFMGPVRGTQDAQQDTAKEVASFARRDIVNTYAWSADGGFFAETTETTDVVTETTSGTYNFTGKATAGASLGYTVSAVGMGFQLDASLGGSLTRTRSRSREATRSFSLEVKVDTPGDLQLYNKDSIPQYDTAGRPIEVPGRVDAYRFMTFYLDSDKANFEDFFGKVVDPAWLNGPTANAAALRQADQADHKPPCWRVLHRVTFVSRKLPDTLDAGAPPLQRAMRAADVSSNFELVRRLEPYVDRAVRSRSELAAKVRDAIKVHLPELTPHSAAIEKFFGDYYGLEELTA